MILLSTDRGVETIHMNSLNFSLAGSHYSYYVCQIAPFFSPFQRMSGLYFLALLVREY